MPVDDISERSGLGETADAGTRRRFLRRALVLGIAAPLAMAVLQACGPGGGGVTPTAVPKPTETKPATGATGTPKPGGSPAAGGTPKPAGATPKASPTS